MLRPKDLCQGSGTKTFLDAMHSGKLHLARFVLDALDGRIINSKTENGRTPLMFAASLQESPARSKFIQLLLEKGADVNMRDEHGRTALSLACELGHLDVVKLLVQFNADPEITDAWGNSALMYAAFAGHNQVLEFLVRAFKRLGLRLDHTNRAGHSAIQVANYFGHSQCVQALNGPGKKDLGLDLGDTWKDQDGEQRQPNKLSKQVLERFSKQFHSKNEEPLPALFQRQLCIGDNGFRTRFKRQPPSPDRMTNGQCQGSPSKNGFVEEDENTLFNTKQIQNSMLRDTRVVKATDFCQEKGSRQDLERRQEVNGHVPLWGKAKSFNLELLTGRKQSYQGDVQDLRHSASKFKRASLQDEKTLMKIEYLEKIHKTRQSANNDNHIKLAHLSHGTTNHLQEENSSDNQSKTVRKEGKGGSLLMRRDALKRGSIPQVARQSKLLLHREEIQPEKITVRPPGYTGLGTRLLRRFTAPEFMRFVRDCPLGNGKGKIARSETFPLSHTHQRVSSQPSVDSISGVRCEFEGSPRCTANNSN